MANDSVGSLYIDVAARTARLETDMSKIKGMVDGLTANVAKNSKDVADKFEDMGASAAKNGLRMAGSFLGVTASLGAIVGVLRNVYKNFDNIPGVPDATVKSIENMKYSMEIANVQVERLGAKLLSAFSVSGQAIGYGLGRLFYGPSGGSFSDVMKQVNVDAENFLALPFEKKVAEMTDRLDRLNATRGQAADVLLREAAALQAIGTGKAPNKDTVGESASLQELLRQIQIAGSMPKAQGKELVLEGLQKQAEAQRTVNELTKEMNQLYITAGNSEAKIGRATLSTKDAVESLRSALGQVRMDLYDNADQAGKKDPIAMEKQIASLKQLIALNAQLGPALLKLKEPMKDMAETFSRSFSGMADVLADFITTGEAKFGDFFNLLIKQMISETIKLSIINPILNGIFGGVAGYSSAPSAFADGGAFSSGSPMIVGENGPELMLPSSSGTVIPAGRTASLMNSGGTGGGDTFHFNYHVAAGVTKPELIQTLKNFQKVIETTIADKSKRGGSFKSAFA